MIVKDEHVEAALAVIGDKKSVRAKYLARKAELNVSRAEARAHRGMNTGTVEDKKMAVRLDTEVIECENDLVELEHELLLAKAEEHEAETIIEVYRTESANNRRGTL